MDETERKRKKIVRILIYVAAAILALLVVGIVVASLWPAPTP